MKTEIDLRGVGAVTVEYDYYPASRGTRDSLGGIRGAGPPLEPDEPAHVEILDCWIDGESYHPKPHERLTLEEKILEAHQPER